MNRKFAAIATGSLVAVANLVALQTRRSAPVSPRDRAAARIFTSVPTRMKFALALDGYAIGDYLPQVVDAADLRNADRVVLIDAELPPLASVYVAAVDRWGGFPPMRERYLVSRAALQKRVEELVARVSAAHHTEQASRKTP